MCCVSAARRGSLEVEFGLALLRRHYDLVPGLGEPGLGTRFGALRGVVPHGHGGVERRSGEIGCPPGACHVPSASA